MSYQSMSTVLPQNGTRIFSALSLPPSLSSKAGKWFLRILHAWDIKCAMYTAFTRGENMFPVRHLLTMPIYVAALNITNCAILLYSATPCRKGRACNQSVVQGPNIHTVLCLRLMANVTFHCLLIYFILMPACVASFFPGLKPFLLCVLLQIHSSCASSECWRLNL